MMKLVAFLALLISLLIFGFTMPKRWGRGMEGFTFASDTVTMVFNGVNGTQGAREFIIMANSVANGIVEVLFYQTNGDTFRIIRPYNGAIGGWPTDMHFNMSVDSLLFNSNVATQINVIKKL